MAALSEDESEDEDREARKLLEREEGEIGEEEFE
jgi:hypothetical protein